MKPLRWLGAGLLWILGGVVGLLGVVLSVTIILLPLGLPLIWLSKRLFGYAAALLVPRGLRHPLSEAGKKGSDLGDGLGKKGRRARRKVEKTSAKLTGRPRRRFGLRLS
jgi:hypothetical protein